ncbi:hypothetical protein NIES267_41720 [Calothrix parasitica NIES-267]|uniref:Uncharacterized protein n=1 Tax=Calothrix parasitica NIES-267 TaxID=1973488 RepID=A0A1Z4LTV1_9CYAN|nr:hypothetical protein NIES267_41720 [Calothrix parasitica NIES-267]
MPLNTVCSFVKTTPQNIAEATAKITKIHKSTLGEDEQPKIVQVNCKTGEGIDRLFEESREILGLEKGKLFQVLIDYQNQKTPRAYTTQVMSETLKLCADVACQKPVKITIKLSGKPASSFGISLATHY